MSARVGGKPELAAMVSSNRMMSWETTALAARTLATVASRKSWPSMSTLYVTCTLLSMIFTVGDFNSVYLLTGGGPADLTHVLATLGIRYLRLDQVGLAMASIVCALPLVLPLVYFMMKRLSR